MTPTSLEVAPQALSLGSVSSRARALLVAFESRVLRPVDIAWLAAYRVLFGLAMAVSMERLIAYRWVETLIVGPGPRFRFHYWGFEWVEPLSLPVMKALVVVLIGLALAMAAGFAFRVTAPLFALGLTYIQLIDVATYLNHYYLAGLVAWLFAVSPAHRAWSVDAWLRRRWSSAAPVEDVPLAWLYVFRVQIGVVYFFAALAKLQPDWLLHGQPLSIWLAARTHLPIVGHLFTLPKLGLVMSWCGFLFDGTIVIWLSIRRTRPYAYAVVLFFHVFTRVLFDIGMFPLIMSASALVFFSPAWPRVWRRLARRSTESWKAKRSRGARLAILIGVLYCVGQVLMPLRAFAYGGNVLWHEQGMRYSWRVMVRAKGGATTFRVRPAGSTRELMVSPRDYLTPYQENEMSGQPDLILQLAHYIARDFEDRGHGKVEVRVDSEVSLNARRGALMIDPAVDLTTIDDGVGLARYILPAPTEPPPETRVVR